MTSQAERIKAFKLAQHARLQKQDDEEQWISSEELCTEGSSDEETHTNTIGYRHRKRNSKAQNRGISPLAQPSKKDEPSIPGLNDTNYLLPEIPTSKSTIERKNQSKEMNRFGKNLIDFSETNSEESLDASDTETMMQWRPKRGSIKLPNSHSLFEMSALFTEMNLTVRNLKLKRTKCNAALFPDIDENEEIRVCASTKYKNNFNISSLLEDVNELDDLISEKSFMLEKVTAERKVIQTEMCFTIVNDSDSSVSMSKNLQTFLDLCHFEMNSSQEDKEEEAEECQMKMKCCKTVLEKLKKYRKSTFKSCCLAKQNSMALCSLTDEEKIQLESLLSDISDSEDCINENNIFNTPMNIKKENDAKNNIKRTKPTKKNDEPMRNYFKLDGDAATVMKNLNVQLHEILESYKEEDVNVHENFSTSTEDLLEAADKEGKYWKHEQIRIRLENIQKNLNEMAVRDEEDQKKLNEIHEIADNDLNNQIN
ncbi:hypothetical protein RN001_001685 [Aquatica leii]|uniref:Fibrous sheath-interacting protein 1 n=1 Tax=Aquatica leii TaxID=1421715 RepID=A0AAN7PG81_9COLE|nr:hypothetical protein RN001_001685 [Aquatica leii]